LKWCQTIYQLARAFTDSNINAIRRLKVKQSGIIRNSMLPLTKKETPKRHPNLLFVQLIFPGGF